MADDDRWQGDRCPLCEGGVIDADATCRWCGVSLRHPAARQALAASRRIGDLTGQYQELAAEWTKASRERAVAIAELRFAHRTAPRTAQPPPPTSAPVALPAPMSMPAPTPAAPPTAARPPAALAPEAAPASVPAPASGSAAGRRVPGQTRRGPTTPVLLGVSGASLLIVAAVIFVAVTWSSFPLAPQVLVILVVAAAIAATAVWLGRHHMPVTSGAVGAVGMGFASMSMVAVERATGAFGSMTTAAVLIVAALAGISLARLGVPGTAGISAGTLSGGAFAAAGGALGSGAEQAVAMGSAVGLGAGLGLAYASRLWGTDAARGIARWSGVVLVAIVATVAPLGSLVASATDARPAGALLVVSLMGVAALIALTDVEKRVAVPTVVPLVGLTALAAGAWWGLPWWITAVLALTVLVVVTLVADRLPASWSNSLDLGLLLTLGLAAVVAAPMALVSAVDSLDVLVSDVPDRGVWRQGIVLLALATWAALVARTTRTMSAAAEWLSLVVLTVAVGVLAAGASAPLADARAWMGIAATIASATIAISARLWRNSAVRTAAGWLAAVGGLFVVVWAFTVAVVDTPPIALAVVTCAAPAIGFAMVSRRYPRHALSGLTIAIVALATMPWAADDRWEVALVAAVAAAAICTWVARIAVPDQARLVDGVSLAVAALGAVYVGVLAVAGTGSVWLGTTRPDSAVLVPALAATAVVTVVVGSGPTRRYWMWTSVVVLIATAAVLPAPTSWVLTAAAALAVAVGVRVRGDRADAVGVPMLAAQALAVAAVVVAGPAAWPLSASAAVATVVGAVGWLRVRDRSTSMAVVLSGLGAGLATGAALAAVGADARVTVVASALVGWAVLVAAVRDSRPPVHADVISGTLLTCATALAAPEPRWVAVTLLASAAGWLAVGWRRAWSLRTVAAIVAWAGVLILTVDVVTSVSHPVSWLAMLLVPMGMLAAACGGQATDVETRSRVGTIGVVFGGGAVVAAFWSGVMEAAPSALVVASVGLPLLAFAVAARHWPAHGLPGVTFAVMSVAALPLARGGWWVEALLVTVLVGAAASAAAWAVRTRHAQWIDGVSVAMAIGGVLYAGLTSARNVITAWGWESGPSAVQPATVLTVAAAAAVAVTAAATRRQWPWISVGAIALAAATLDAPSSWVVASAGAAAVLVVWWRGPVLARVNLSASHAQAVAAAAVVLAGADAWPLAVTTGIAAATGMVALARRSGHPGLSVALASLGGAVTGGAGVYALGGSYVLVGIVVAIAGWVPTIVALLRGWVGIVPALVVGAVVTIMAPVITQSIAWAGTATLISAVGWMVVGLGRSREVRIIAVVLAWVGTGSIVASAGVTSPEAYVVIPASFALVVGFRTLRRRETASSLVALGPGLALLLVPSVVALALDPSHVLRVLALVAGVAILAGVGVLAQLRAPVLGAAIASIALALTQVTVADAVVPRWLSFAVVGVLLLALGATYEKWRALR